jgi:propanol-preferring alcohol dehydrogenase
MDSGTHGVSFQAEATMRAMLMEKTGQPLALRDVSKPEPTGGEVLVRVLACGVCRTDLHVLDGELSDPKLPLVLGHQIVGIVERVGAGVTHLLPGARVGVPWLGGTCGHCRYCLSARENLCDEATFTGYRRNGGFAEYAVAEAGYCFPLVGEGSDVETAPLLCAGLIGYRSLRLAGDAERLGIYGFGAAAHIVAQVARHQGRRVYAFTRPGDRAAQEFAMRLGVDWVGGSDQVPPEALDAGIVFASAGELVPKALGDVAKGGTVVCGGIHMTDIPSFPYSALWGERVVRSVANLTRADAREFLELAPKIPVRVDAHPYPLERANEALDDLRRGRLSGAAVIDLRQ